MPQTQWKKRPHLPNLEELLNQITAELSKNDHDPIWISVIDLDYAYGQMKLPPETSKHCNCAMTSEKNGDYRFLKGFYGPADIPTIFQEKIDRTLGHQTPVWLDDIIIVTRRQRKNTPEFCIRFWLNWKTRDTEQARKNRNFTKKNNMAWTHNITRWYQTEQGKNRHDKQTRTTNKHQATKVLSRRNTVFCKIHPNLSDKTRKAGTNKHTGRTIATPKR